MELRTIKTPENITYKLSHRIPDYVIQEREAGKGQMLSYVSGATVIDILNSTFGYLGRSFETLQEWKEESVPFFQKKTKWYNPPAELLSKNDKGEDGALLSQGPVAWVKGRLTVFVEDENGDLRSIVKEAYGSKSIIGKQSEQEHIFKSAQTDALKKAASLLGIGADLYRGQSEQAYYDVISKPIVWTDEKQASSPIWANALNLCSANGWAISDLDYYVNELTEGAYTDIYTLPEAWLESLLESLSEEEGE